eukprot:354922-Chlamydomonas_euryale.AAC.3
MPAHTRCGRADLMPALPNACRLGNVGTCAPKHACVCAQLCMKTVLCMAHDAWHTAFGTQTVWCMAHG